MAILAFCTNIQFVAGQSSTSASRFAAVDERVNAVTKQLVFQPQLLVEQLTEGFTNDYDKTRALYGWIARNVTYDLFAYKHNRYEGQTVNGVLRSGKALCSGYSLVMQYFCSLADIRCEIIEGYAKGYGYRKNQQFKTSNHAWNAVYIHGAWYFLDVTWASGVPQELSGQKQVVDLDGYFLIPPEKLILTHLPEDPSWQMQPRKISLREFETGQADQEVGKTDICESCSPMDYEGMNEFDADILKYKRSVHFNPRYLGLNQRLAFAYAYKAISMTDGISKLEYNMLKDSLSILESTFNQYIDSAVATISKANDARNAAIITVEADYQRGIFLYEVGVNIFEKGMKGRIPNQRDTPIIRELYTRSAVFFKKVAPDSIYYPEANKYLESIGDYLGSG